MTAGASATILRGIEQAAEARESAELFSWRSSSRIALSASDPTLITEIDVLKVGVFNGWTFTASDLEAMVEHFAALTEASIFTPPVRIDHSWSLLQVVGWVTALRTAQAVDPTTQQVTTYLRADATINDPMALDLIKRGIARNRSSEIGPYETNAGTTFPLVYYGFAFVDIPAVEGLQPIQLSRRYGVPRSVTQLSNERSGAMSGQAGEQQGSGSGEQQGSGEQGSGEQQQGGAAGSGEQGSGSGSAGSTSAPSTDGGATGSAPSGETEAQAELRQMREERAQLRQEAAQEAVERFSAAGVVVKATESHAMTLLAHEDKAVRDAAKGLLGGTPSAVKLGQRLGAQQGTSESGSTGSTSTGSGGSGAGGEIQLSDDADEVGAWWAELDTAQRKPGTPEHVAMTKWRQSRSK